MNLSVAFITSRYEPRFQWFLDSLKPQILSGDNIEILWCDLHFTGEPFRDGNYVHFQPKPCVWSGPHRILKENWWSKSNSINTAICLAKHDTIAFCDDRCVLGPHWLDSVREAQSKQRVVVGSYAKYHGMKVQNGKILDFGKCDSSDQRQYAKDHQVKVEPNAFFGCTWVSPLEWLLEMNGADERLDGTSMEDIILGYHFVANGHSVWYDARMLCLQDRTPEECGPAMKRSSRQRYPYDKEDRAWRALERIAKQKRANPDFDLREMRTKVQNGEPFPPVDPNKLDWWNNQPIKEWDNL